MKSLFFLGTILFSSLNAGASTSNSTCDWLISKWKCSSKNNWSGIEETIYYNIVRSSNSSFRINSHPTKTPEADSPLGYEVFLDGRSNQNIKGISRCEDSKLSIEYLNEMSDVTSAYQENVFKKQSSGMQLIKSYFNTGDVTFTNCVSL